MLREHPIHATIPATDLERARAFYADKLGLTPTREEPAGLVYETPGGHEGLPQRGQRSLPRPR
jgi:catechol 2,3-dioxygenase-like lactoylglutathione lyase family enzyme